MPNHIINELIFRNVGSDQQESILAALCNGEGQVDFNILVPCPLNVWMGNVSKAHEEAFGQTGLGWNRENWGTKWNAYSQQTTERADDTITLRFETAWAPPYPWLAAVFNKLLLPFEHNWLDEGASRGWSATFWTDEHWGPEWKQEPASDEMQRHLHKLHWGVEQFEEAKS